MAVYKAPDPVAAARLVETHGMDGAAGRYYWLSRDAVVKIVQHGREILRGQSGQPIPARGKRRTTTPEAEDAAVAAALRLGSVHRAARETGYQHTFILTLLRERGIPVPRLSREERIAAVKAGQARVAAAAETPTATERAA
ncbi:hypothetical protein [Methylorubrum suomiense]|uniref:Uncharacterized protein n=1 Tax=Methylorubrum suomiense TaxID=144191 RepID=A0ABQ4UQC6_9HYPH|nr:hypothetical protein [Methylorubrum suomiense]GJE74329.1 hypothetical protein BGCPKDLD_0898 [Methylorubrum suomiense]